MNEPFLEVYTDTFVHSLDAKGRITIPSEWRSEKHEKRLHVFPSSEGCLKVYPASFLARQVGKMADRSITDPSRKAIARIAQVAQAVSCDEQGRINIKPEYRTRATLGKGVVLVGCSDHFQIWNQTDWEKREKVDATFEDLAREAGL